MKTSQKTIVLHTIELSEVDLDIAIVNYPNVEQQILGYIKKWFLSKKLPIPMHDISISMTVEFKTEDKILNGREPVIHYAHIDSALGLAVALPPDHPTASREFDPTPNTETKDVIMEPGALMGNLIKNSKPADDEED